MSLVYRIEVSQRARKEIAALERSAQQRVVAAIEHLAANPRPAGCTKLTARPAWRIRVGEYRVIYEIADERLIVLVIRVGHRREVYRER